MKGRGEGGGSEVIKGGRVVVFGEGEDSTDGRQSRGRLVHREERQIERTGAAPSYCGGGGKSCPCWGQQYLYPSPRQHGGSRVKIASL